MQLSKRLEAVANMVSVGNRLVDVGTDHSYIPIYLCESGKIPCAIAMDINKGPLNRAREHIKEHNLQNNIQTRLSDGVTALKGGEADTLIIAGMGGGLVIKILSEGEEIISSIKELILQPQSEIEEVRRFLKDHGYIIIEENIVIDDGKYYPMMKAVKGAADYDNVLFFKYGKLLLESQNEVLKLFLEKELNTYINIEEKLLSNPNENTINRAKEIKYEIQCIREALKYYEQ